MEKRNLLFPYPSSTRRPTGLRSEHYALGIISKEVNGEPYLLVYSTRRGSEKWKFRFPGSRQRIGENPTATLLRACEEKIGVSLQSDKCYPCMTTTLPYLQYSQAVFFIDATGKDFSLRKETRTIVEEVGGKTRKEEWKAPEWVPLCAAGKKLLSTHYALLLLSTSTIQRFQPSYRRVVSLDRIKSFRHRDTSFVRVLKTVLGLQPCCNG